MCQAEHGRVVHSNAQGYLRILNSSKFDPGEHARTNVLFPCGSPSQVFLSYGDTAAPGGGIVDGQSGLGQKHAENLAYAVAYMFFKWERQLALVEEK